MITLTKKIFFGLLILFVSGLLYSVLAQSMDEGTVQLEIKGFGIRHGTPENFTLGTITSSPGDQYISGQFADYFRIEDIEGYITGHYTTIQCDGVYGPYNYILTGIELMAGNTTPELIMGYTGPNVYINSALNTYTSIIEPITYIYKNTNISNASLVNKYGDKPWLKILIPPTAPAGVYSGTIVFSFYME